MKKKPTLTDAPCTLCEECVDACREDALTTGDSGPAIDHGRCLSCGKCILVCESGSITQGAKGYRVQVGGKLGRHPQLARELPGIYNDDQVLRIIQWCLDFYKQNSKAGERFAELLTASDLDRLILEEGNPKPN